MNACAFMKKNAVGAEKMLMDVVGSFLLAFLCRLIKVDTCKWTNAIFSMWSLNDCSCLCTHEIKNIMNRHRPRFDGERQ